MFKSAGDSSLALGMTIYYFTGGVERSGDSLKNTGIVQNKVCESPLLSPYTTRSRLVIPSDSEESSDSGM